jgi:hypothetical protein
MAGAQCIHDAVPYASPAPANEAIGSKSCVAQLTTARATAHLTHAHQAYNASRSSPPRLARRLGLSAVLSSFRACAAYGVCHLGPALTPGARLTFGAVARGLVLRLGIDLGADQNHNDRKPQPSHKANRRA